MLLIGRGIGAILLIIKERLNASKTVILKSRDDVRHWFGMLNGMAFLRDTLYYNDGIILYRLYVI